MARLAIALCIFTTLFSFVYAETHGFVWFRQPVNQAKVDEGLWIIDAADSAAYNFNDGWLYYDSQLAFYLYVRLNPSKYDQIIFPENLTSIALDVSIEPLQGPNPNGLSRYICCLPYSDGMSFGLATVKLTQPANPGSMCGVSSTYYYTDVIETWYHANSSCPNSDCTFGAALWSFGPNFYDLNCASTTGTDGVLLDIYNRKIARTLIERRDELTYISMDVAGNPRFDGYAHNPLVGPPSWFEVGTAAPQNADLGEQVTRLNGFVLKSVEFRLLGQCRDFNSLSGDGCDPQGFIEPFSLCRSVPNGLTLVSSCQTITDLSSAMSILTTNFTSLPLRTRLLDSTYVQSSIGTNIDVNTTTTISIKCPIANCDPTLVRSKFVRISLRSMIAEPNLLTDPPQIVSINNQFFDATYLVQFEVSDASVVQLDLTSFSPAPGMVVQVFQWLNVYNDSADVLFVSPQGAVIAATGAMTMRANNLRPIVASRVTWVPVGVSRPSLSRLRYFSFTSPIDQPAQVSAFLYDAPSDMSIAIQAVDAALIPVTTSCSRSGALYNCSGNFPDLSNGDETAVVAVRLTFTSFGTGPVVPVARALQLPAVNPIPTIIARNIAEITITGRFFRSSPNITTELLVHGSTAQGVFDGAAESLTSRVFLNTLLPFDPTSPANADLYVRVTAYTIVSTYPIGTVYRSPVNLTAAGDFFYQENSTLIIRGDGFNVSDSAAHEVSLRQAGSNSAACVVKSATAALLICEMRDQSTRPIDGLIFAKVSIYRGRFSSEVQIGTYVRSLINSIWRPETASDTWSRLRFALNQTSATADIEIPPLQSSTAIAVEVAPFFGVNPTDIDVRYQLTSDRKVLALIYCSTLASQAQYELYATPTNATLISRVAAAIQSALSTTSYMASFLDGTATANSQVFSGRELLYRISSETATSEPTITELARIRNGTTTLLRLTYEDILLRLTTPVTRALQRSLTFYFTTENARQAFATSAPGRNTSLQAALNQIIEDSLPGWTSIFVSADEVQVPFTAAPTDVVAVATSLGAGAIAGIAVAAIVVVLAIVIGAAIFGRRYRRMQAEKQRAENTAAEIPKQFEEMMGNWSIKSSDIEIGKKLGEGSFGAVFKGSYKGKPVAIKKLAANMLGTQVSAFFQEAATMFAIKPNKNVVRMYGMCQEMGNLQMIMEFLPGGSLDALLAKREVTAENQLKFVDFYHFARGIAVGMRHIALSGIVHRDLAARNILLDESTPPAPKIADFGFSRVVGDNEQGKTNSTVGPIKWMAPENLSSQTYSEKSDVWSYGALLVEMLTGKEPFPKKDILSIAVGVRDGKFTAIDFMPKIVKPPKWVRQMIKACFTFDVSERPSFQDLINIMNENVPEGYQINTAEEDAGLDKTKSTKTNTNKTQRTAEPHSGKSGNYDDAVDLDSDKQAQKTSSNKTAKGKSNYSDSVAITEVQPSTISPSEKVANNKQGNYTSFGAQAPTEKDSKKSLSKEMESQDSSSDSSSSDPASSDSGSDSSSDEEDSSASSSSSAESSSE